MKIIKCFSLLALLVVAGCGQASEANNTTTKLTVSAASSMMESLMEVKEIVEAEYPAIEITYNFGGSGTLRRQIEQGAPIDLFFSASKRDYEALKGEGLIRNGSAILENKLVMITSDQVPLDSVEEFFQSDKKMAIGTPVAVPAGTYSQQALEEMGMWEKLEDRLIFTKDVQQVLTYVEEGNVDVGMVYLSDVRGVENIEVLEVVDPNYHPPIEYFAASIQNGDDQKVEAIETFYDYVQSDKSMKLFERYGFQTTSRENE
ncbi:molybdate transport system substrate-binding protein [Virgibacillus natechei]|uniref:Molybdate transport system substrate-binding protein n=1 Tax=Virgibacillus natechei TaxID=1216297 RepID=A0ABS4IG22_9BACI|nr:molybdate ABC transporter substrate-binding protein [Virgibacillus natechei]MBP1969892.1 molybdate transport system substrate-binding protein [Virgibacillus natechei]UZD13441.1 molybdate ABC transporter substrate-binding protein [Virgibacillus natechei]